MSVESPNQINILAFSLEPIAPMEEIKRVLPERSYAPKSIVGWPWFRDLASEENDGDMFKAKDKSVIISYHEEEGLFEAYILDIPNNLSFLESELYHYLLKQELKGLFEVKPSPASPVMPSLSPQLVDAY